MGPAKAFHLARLVGGLRSWMLLSAATMALPRALQGQLPSGMAASLGADLGTLPDALSKGCGRSPSGVMGTSYVGALRYQRPGTAFYGQFDLRLARSFDNACTLEFPPVVALSATEFETRPGRTYAAGYPRSGFAASLVRLGVEHQVEVLTAGLYAAGGVVWARRSVPLVALGARLAFGQRSLRVFVEGERARARVDAQEVRVRYAYGPPQRELGRTVVELREWQPWPSVRVGLSWHRQ